MIGPQDAVKIAVGFIKSFENVQQWDTPWLEEISQTDTQWVITLGLAPVPLVASEELNPRRAKELKVFRINKDDGQIASMKIKANN